MITRTPYADEILKHARTRIHRKALPAATIVHIQRGALRFKTKVKARINIRQFLNKAVPQCDIKYVSPTPSDYGKSLFYYLNMAFGSKHHLRKYIPFIAKIERRIIPIL
jgi:hypothetical protein